MVSPLRKQRDIDRKENTRQDLVNSAIDIFCEKGYHPSLISDIVAKAGVGQGTFYRHFKSKRDLIDSVMEQFGQMLLGQFAFMTENLPSNEEEYFDASIRGVRALAGMVQQNRKLVLLLLREGPTVDREFEQQINTLYDQFAQLAAFYLDHAIAKGFARPCNSTIVAQSIIGMGLRHVNNWLQSDENNIDVDQLIQELVGFAFYGFGSTRGEDGRNEP